MRRPTILDLSRHAGVSVATVDRVLNRRQPVRRQTAERVLSAAEAIGYHAAGLIRHRLDAEPPRRTLGFVLQWRSEEFYRNLGAALAAATQTATTISGRPLVVFLDDLAPAAVVVALHRMAEKADAVALVAADHPNISRAVEELRGAGVPVVTLLSDLSAPARAGYVGLDHRKVGRTAAWMVARLARRPGKVAILIGSHRYLGHELCEISFRSWFREHAPDFDLAEPLINGEEPRVAYEAILGLLGRAGGLAGIYVAGGGTEGVIAALREAGSYRDVVAVCPELTQATRAALIDGVVDLVISNPLPQLAAAAVGAMAAAVGGAAGPPGQILLPFEIYTSENL